MFQWFVSALAEDATAATTEVAVEAAKKSSYVKDTLFKKIITADISFWLMLVGLVALAAIFFAIAKSRKSWNLKCSLRLC